MPDLEKNNGGSSMKTVIASHPEIFAASHVVSGLTPLEALLGHSDLIVGVEPEYPRMFENGRKRMERELPLTTTHRTLHLESSLFQTKNRIISLLDIITEVPKRDSRLGGVYEGCIFVDRAREYIREQPCTFTLLLMGDAAPLAPGSHTWDVPCIGFTPSRFFGRMPVYKSEFMLLLDRKHIDQFEKLDKDCHVLSYRIQPSH